MQQKGFTLIELLIVIGIIAILAVTVILTLNPAQLLAQARDSQRISDMATLKSAVTLFVADQTTPSMGSSSTCYGSANATPGSAGCGGRMASTDTTVTTSTANASTTGGGWIPINFTAISSGSPFGTEPLDPTNTATYFYSYAVNATTYQFELDAHMESNKFHNGGSNDVESTDGGNNANVYETGTSLTL